MPCTYTVLTVGQASTGHKLTHVTLTTALRATLLVTASSEDREAFGVAQTAPACLRPSSFLGRGTSGAKTKTDPGEREQLVILHAEVKG